MDIVCPNPVLMNGAEIVIQKSLLQLEIIIGILVASDPRIIFPQKTLHAMMG